MKSFILSRTLLCLALAASPCAMAEPMDYTSGQDLTLSSQTLTSAAAGRDISLNNTLVEGKLSAGRNISCQGCTISGAISAGRDVALSQCPQVYGIASGRNTDLRQTRVLNQISSGFDVTLQDTHVEQGIQAGNQFLASNSTVQGTISLGGRYAKLDHSTVGEVRFLENNNLYAGSGNHIHINSGNLFNGNVTMNRNGASYVHVGIGSLSSVNGYTIKGAPQQTTLITPEQTIYVNGSKVSGDGPKHYSDYMANHPGAPNVQGPGWTDAPVDSHTEKADKKDSKTPVNVLEITNQSTINGQVVFESGYGKIIVHPGSQFNGKVINGTVEKLSNQSEEAQIN